MTKNRLKLRVLLFVAFTLVSAVPVLMLAVWVQHSAYEKEIAAVREKHLIIARNLSAAISRYVQDVKSGFEHLVSLADRHIDMFDREGYHQLLETLYLEGPFILDSSFSPIGLNSSSSPTGGHRSHQEKTFRDFSKPVLRALLETSKAGGGKVVLSDLTRHQGKPVFLLGKANKNGGMAVGILRTDYLVKMQKSISFGKKGHAMFVDRTGRVIALPDKEWRPGSREAVGMSAVQAMMRGETGVSMFYSPHHKADMIAGYTSVPEVGWGVMVPQPLSELTDRARDVQWIAAWLSILGVLIAIIISWWLSKFLSRPIERVQAAAGQIAAGNLNARVEDLPRLSPIELRDLSGSFNRMAERVSIANAELTKAVVEAEGANIAKSEFLKETLASHNKLRASEEKIKTALEEKEILLKEIHHRVKNNLQVVSSMLSLQAQTQGNNGSFKALQESQRRIQVMSRIHENLHASDNLSSINTNEFFNTLVDDTKESVGGSVEGISFRLDMDDIALDMEQAIPYGQIISELISNSLKHAFPDGQSGEITISLHRLNGGETALAVADDGKGLPENFNFHRAQTLGLKLVQAIVMQLKGVVDVDSSGGTRIQIIFPKA